MFQGEIRSYTQDSRKKLCVAFNAKTFIASAVKKKVVENMNTVKQAKYNGDEVESYIISTIDKYFGKAPVSDVTILAPSAENYPFLKVLPSVQRTQIIIYQTRRYKCPPHHGQGEN